MLNLAQVNSFFSPWAQQRSFASPLSSFSHHYSKYGTYSSLLKRGVLLSSGGATVLRSAIGNGEAGGRSSENKSSFADRHADKRGVTGRFSVFAEGLNAEEMTASEFRDALKEKLMERRRKSPGNKASQDYM